MENNNSPIFESYSFRQSSMITSPEDYHYFYSKLTTSLNSVQSNSSTFFSKTIGNISNSFVDSGCMPPGVRFIAPGIIVFEKPPEFKNIQYLDYTLDEMSEPNYDEERDEYLDEDRDFNEEINIYRIPIPWQLYIITYSLLPQSKYHVTSVRMYFMNSSLNSPDTNLYAPYIPNFFQSGQLCAAKIDTMDDILRYPQDISGTIACAYDWVWNTGFNRDLIEPLSNTIANRNLNSIVSDFYEKNYVIPHPSFFYRHLSNYSLQDVVNVPWASFSYSNYYEMDFRTLYKIPFYKNKFIEDVKEQYLIENQVSEFPSEMLDSTSSNIENDSSYFSMNQFKDWYGDPTEHKTYRDLIQYFFSTIDNLDLSTTLYITHNLKNSSTSLNYENFVNTALSSVF